MKEQQVLLGQEEEERCLSWGEHEVKNNSVIGGKLARGGAEAK